ncbi:MAG TPA: MFS transporter [Acidimicrobiales bacterium]|nr:MFS transporter [Acidimicrobiales bacterium]
MSLAQGMILLDVTIVDVALPSVQRGLHMSAGRLEWVVSAYALALAALIPLGGALGDRFGRRRCFLFGMAVFTLGSAGCALATVDLQLIAFRAVQGMGGAMMSSLTLSILVEATPEDDRPAAIGTWTAIAGLGFMVGPIVGGLLLSLFGWSSVFWVNVPLGVLGVVLTLGAVAESKDPSGRHLDLPGAVLASAGLFMVTFGLVESADRSWGSSVVLGSILAGAAVLAAFFWWEHRTVSPMIPPAMLRQHSFAVGNVVMLVGFLALTGMFFFVTLYFQNLEGWSALKTGVSWLALGVPFLFVAQSSGKLTRRFAPGVVIATGCAVAAVGIGGLSFLTAAMPIGLVLVWYACIAAGFGLLSPAASTVVMSSVEGGASGIASGILNTSRQVGTSVGLAVLGSIGVTVAVREWRTALAGDQPASVRHAAGTLAGQVASGRLGGIERRFGTAVAGQAAGAFEDGMQVALLAGGGLLLVGGVLALLVLRRPPAIAPVAGGPAGGTGDRR